MKVKCINNKISNKEKIYTNLTLNKDYIVLAIEFYDKEISIFSNSIGDYILYRIEDNDGLVKPIPSKLFTITSGKLPECWISYRDDDECYSMLPKEWAKTSFWEDFYNDDYKTLEVFKSVKKQIYVEEENN